MIYRPQQSQGEGKSEDLNAYWHRKQGGPKHNRVAPEGKLHGPDRDCDAEENFSYGKTGWPKPKDKTETAVPTKSPGDIWDDSVWKDD